MQNLISTGAPEITKVLTPMFRGSYSKMEKPAEGINQKTGKAWKKWEITGVFDLNGDFQNDPTFRPLIEIAVKAAMKKFSTTENIKFPFRLGESYNLDKNPFYKGKLIIPFGSYNVMPDAAVLVAGKAAKLDPKDFATLYSGAWFIARVSAFAYTTGGNGISFNLHEICKIKDDEPLAAHNDAEEAFADIDPTKYGVDSSQLFGSGSVNPADPGSLLGAVNLLGGSNPGGLNLGGSSGAGNRI